MKNKSFYFDDYTESEIKNNNNNTNFIKVSLNRIAFLYFIFISLLIIFSIKITYLSLAQEKDIYLNNEKKNFIQTRGEIIDRNGSVVATNVNLYNVGIRSSSTSADPVHPCHCLCLCLSTFHHRLSCLGFYLYLAWIS